MGPNGLKGKGCHSKGLGTINAPFHRGSPNWDGILADRQEYSQSTHLTLEIAPEERLLFL